MYVDPCMLTATPPLQVQFTLDSLHDAHVSTSQQVGTALEAMARLCWSDDDARLLVGEEGGTQLVLHVVLTLSV